MGAWIETLSLSIIALRCASHPAWVRGLKLFVPFAAKSFEVAPRVGAWIETRNYFRRLQLEVAPRVGAWIETLMSRGHCKPSHESHPAWVRGLKRCCFVVVNEES